MGGVLLSFREVGRRCLKQGRVKWSQRSERGLRKERGKAEKRPEKRSGRGSKVLLTHVNTFDVQVGTRAVMNGGSRGAPTGGSQEGIYRGVHIPGYQEGYILGVWETPRVSGRLSWGVWEAVLGVREGLGGCSRCPGGSRRVLGVYLGGS